MHPKPPSKRACCSLTGAALASYHVAIDDGLAGQINGVCLVLSFIFLRIGVCSVAAIAFGADLGQHDSSDTVEWFVLVLAYVLFLAVLLLSYVWLWTQVLPGLRAAVKGLLQQRRAARAQRRIEQQAKAAANSAAPAATFSKTRPSSRAIDEAHSPPRKWGGRTTRVQPHDPASSASRVPPWAPAPPPDVEVQGDATGV